MKKRTMLIGALALIFGVSAAFGVYLLAANPAASPKAEMVSLVVAAVDINRGQSLTSEFLTHRDWPKEAVPEGALTDLAELLDRTATVSLMKGDLLFDAKLAPRGAGRGMAAVIPSGMRAVSIQTNNVSTGVAGFILPGNKVDVLLSVSTQGADDRTGGGSTITLLQNVEILAVDQRIDAPQDNKMDAKELRSVTLLVNPADAAKLDLGQNKGTLHLVLRNATDTGTEDVEPATLAGLKVGSSEPIVVVQKSENIPPAPAKKAPLLIRTLRGSRSGYITFPTPEEAPRDDEAADSQTSTASSTEVEASAGPASSVDPAAPAIH